jgi:hypothetical protein
MAFDDKKNSAGGPVDERIAREIRSRLIEKGLPCAAAMATAEFMKADPLEIGRAADALGIRLTTCQLGLFGFPGRVKGWVMAGAPDRPLPFGFEAAVRAARSADGAISCITLWAVAARFSVPRIQAGSIADRLGITVRKCQLGAF